MTPATSKEFPRTVFHADGVHTSRAETETDFLRFMNEGIWFELPQPPPPPAEPDMTTEESQSLLRSELNGLGEQVDAQANVISSLERRTDVLEAALKNAHAAFEQLEHKISAIERRKGKE